MPVLLNSTDNIFQVKVKSDVTLEDALTKALKLRDLTVRNCYAYNTTTR